MRRETPAERAHELAVGKHIAALHGWSVKQRPEGSRLDLDFYVDGVLAVVSEFKNRQNGIHDYVDLLWSRAKIDALVKAKAKGRVSAFCIAEFTDVGLRWVELDDLDLGLVGILDRKKPRAGGGSEPHDREPAVSIALEMLQPVDRPYVRPARPIRATVVVTAAPALPDWAQGWQCRACGSHPATVPVETFGGLALAACPTSTCQPLGRRSIFARKAA